MLHSSQLIRVVCGPPHTHTYAYTDAYTYIGLHTNIQIVAHFKENCHDIHGMFENNSEQTCVHNIELKV